MNRPDQAAIRVLCAALHDAPWKSCAHLAHAVRQALDEEGADEDVAALIEEELGVGLDPVSPERMRALQEEGLLPKPFTADDVMPGDW